MIKCPSMELSPNVRSWLRPAVHFLVLGGALLLLVTAFSGGSKSTEEASSEVVLTAERVQQLEAEWQRHLGRAPTPTEKDTLLAKAVDDELFFTEAINLQLHRKDRRVHDRLRSLLEFSGFQMETGESEEDSLELALELGLHQRDALVHGWLVALGQQAALQAGEGTSIEEALERLRKKYRIRIQEITSESGAGGAV